MLKTTELDDSSKAKEKTFYIIIFFSKTKETEIAFKFDSKKTEQYFVFPKENNNGIIRNTIILKHAHIPKNLSEIIDISFINNGEIFKVSFSVSEGTFIFNPTLKIKKNKTSNEKTISQKNVIKITDKINLLIKCLEKKKENEKLGILFNDGVELFKSNLDFELLIYLFNKVCATDKSLKEICKKLLDIFWDKTTIDTGKEKESIPPEEINNLSQSCQQYNDKIKEIASKSERIISEYGFDKTKLYGLILFYFNTYDINQFHELSQKLGEQKEKEKQKDNFFFDILAHFSTTFSNETKINLDNYIDYLMGKDFKALDILGFIYFKRIEEFIKIINKKKERLIKLAGFKTIKLPKQLDYNLKNPEIFIKELDSILEFSQKENKLLLFLSEAFWKQTTEVLGQPSADNIYHLFQLRENFKKYFKFVKEHYKKDHAFYKNAEETDGKDESAVTLNRIVQKNIEESNEITNDQIINQITKFDVYYREDNYIKRRDLDFLDKINFDDEENEWVCSFKNSKFEEIFKNDIDNYILKLVSKIKKLEDLGRVIDIINEDEIKNMNKMEYLIGLLRRKVFNLLKSSDILRGSVKIYKLKALTSLFTIIYEHTKKLEKIEDILDKLENENKHIIFLELLKKFENNQPLQDYMIFPVLIFSKIQNKKIHSI